MLRCCAHMAVGAAARSSRCAMRSCESICGFVMLIALGGQQRFELLLVASIYLGTALQSCAAQPCL
eukprot:2339875-Pleurochrysis_carterae.AAC.3